MPGILTALAESGTSYSILTKGTLLRRDLPLIAEAEHEVPVPVCRSRWRSSIRNCSVTSNPAHRHRRPGWR